MHHYTYKKMIPQKHIDVGGHRIGPGNSAFVVAEMSANHLGSYQRAEAIVRAAAHAGANAIKLQTYTPNSLTIDCREEYFRLAPDSPWAGSTLYDLYKEAATPYDWHPRLFELAKELGLVCFSTPFDEAGVDFLEQLHAPLYKVASFELCHLPLLRRIAGTGKPVILSTGLGTIEEVDQAVNTLLDGGARQIGLLKCTSGYPAPPEEMNLLAIPMMAKRYRIPVGLSDHTLDNNVAIAALALGAAIIEKHLTLKRSDGGPDAGFSVEPHELDLLVKALRITGRSLGRPQLTAHESEQKNRQLRRSIFAVTDIDKGEILTPDNIRIIRPSDGLPPKYYDHILGKQANRRIPRGTPLEQDMFE